MVAAVTKDSTQETISTNDNHASDSQSTQSDAKRKDLKLRKRNKKKSKKQREEEEAKRKASLQQIQPKDEALDDVEIEYVVQPVDYSELKNMSGMDNVDEDVLQQLSDVFKHFQTGKEDEVEEGVVEAIKQEEEEEGVKVEEDEDDEEKAEKAEKAEKEAEQALSKKKMKKMQRLTVAELKQLVKKPEAVEWWDVTASDPKLLVNLKAYRNTVPVPAHWSQKRKYLQGKRGIEKPPWELPDFIKDTGIMEMREAVKEKEDAAKLKSKMRERVAPKMGKLDIDYQKLHDAFFRFQTKPKLSLHGELYYEGKEFETKLKEKKPGQLSEELKTALNMPPLAPPPWLINMQRYGPPPSYPSLKIAGLNAPIPEGGQWGYHPGGWGRPPVDEYNRPLYGDVFGVTQQDDLPPEVVEPIDRKLWGELESDEEFEEEEDDEDEDEEEEGGDDNGTESTAQDDTIKEGLETPSGMASVASGLETPDFIELRKDVRKQEEDEAPKQLYQVLPEMPKNITGFMGSQHGYDLSTVEKPVTAPTTAVRSSKRKMGDNVDVTIDPSELESGLDESTMRAKYDAEMRAKLPVGAGSEDLSDLYAEHASRQAKKMKTQDSKKDSKKKEFKF